MTFSIFATFDEAGLATGFYSPAIHGDAIPNAAVSISEEDWRNLASEPNAYRWTGAKLVPQPVVLPPAPVHVAKADLWRRATDAEAETIDAALNAQPVRLRNLFRDAAYLSSADELWPTLRAGFVAAFGEARAAELLAPSA